MNTRERVSVSHIGHPHTKESKLKISIKRREHLEKSKKNHNWSFCHGKQSDPEKKFQAILDELKIQHIPEHTPEESKRFYRIDFAILDKKLVLRLMEINTIRMRKEEN
jgi:hypothetical protein